MKGRLIQNFLTAECECRCESYGETESPPYECTCRCHLRQSCRPYCECVCHKRQRLTSARSLQAIFGSLSMKYHSLPLISTCNIRSCRRREGAFLHIRYRFPSWLVAQAISLMASSAGSGGPEASLRVNSLISSLHPIFSAIESANISGIKDMLASREVSLNDISESGFTPLDVSDFSQWLLSRLLTFLF